MTITSNPPWVLTVKYVDSKDDYRLFYYDRGEAEKVAKELRQYKHVKSATVTANKGRY